MKSIVNEWYEDKNNVDEMVHWINGKLKKWEQDVTHYFPKCARILDIGCGMGREAFALSDLGFTVTGIDISHEVIKQVTQLSLHQGRKIPFICYEGTNLPFENESFDVVIIWAQTFGLLYGNDHKHNFLKEILRVLKADGILSFSGHDYKYEMEHYKNCMKGRNFYPYANTKMHWETFYLEELISFAENAGYTILLSGKGEIYKPEDGTVLHCLCKKVYDLIA
jgi:SAM-dependent methyltransferase